MRWQGRQQSTHIEDRTGQAFPGGGGFGGGLGSNPFGQGGINLPTGSSGRGGGLGIVGLIVVVGIAWLVFGINPLQLLTGGDSGNFTQAPPPSSADDAALKEFVGVVLNDTETFWTDYFAKHGLGPYHPPTLVMFNGQTDSGCGTADTASGPFYCPTDGKVYIDLAFYQQLRDQFGAPGDFAQAYVIAHEVGHHVQDEVGTLPAFNDKRQGESQTAANADSVKIELQADCFAGLWGRGELEQGFTEDGDFEEAIHAAQQIGDDRLTGGRVPATEYTHGTSAQRMQWLQKGLASSTLEECDTGFRS